MSCHVVESDIFCSQMHTHPNIHMYTYNMTRTIPEIFWVDTHKHTMHIHTQTHTSIPHPPHTEHMENQFAESTKS